MSAGEVFRLDNGKYALVSRTRDAVTIDIPQSLQDTYDVQIKLSLNAALELSTAIRRILSKP